MNELDSSSLPPEGPLREVPAAPASNAPVSQSERLTSIDGLRGFALLGILVVNIQSFALIGAKYLNPMALGELHGADYGAWWFTYVFFDSKFMTLFSLLFGAGVVLMWERAKQAGKKFTGLHYRRMFWLMLFGLAHGHLLWYGDILFLYSICGMLVVWLCGLRARWLIPLGLLTISVGSATSLLSGLSLPYWDEAELASMMEDWTPPDERVQEELAIYRGGWLGQLSHRSPNAFFMETFLFLFWGIWRAGGLMLVGMGLFKLGVFSGGRSDRFYVLGGTAAGLLGLSTVCMGVAQFEAAGWSFEYSFFFGNQYNYWGSLGLSFAYACGVMWLWRRGWLSVLRKSLAAVGQMALTNYLLHTLICTTLFYGHGLGWFGSLNRIELLAIVALIWAFQLIASPIWLSRFRFGPFEWLWRSLTYWRWQPIVRAAQGTVARPLGE